MPATSFYSVHPSVAYVQNIIAKMKGKTGRSLEEWITFVKKEGPKSEADRRVWLKDTHKLGTNYASWIAGRADGKGRDDDDPVAYLKKAPELVEAMFAGKRAPLRPLYDRLLKMGLGIGKEAKACPCQTIVPLYRNHVFAEIKPATNSRIDVGLALGNVKAKLPARIEAVKNGKGNRITHRIPIESADQIDAFVEKWLKTAYEADTGAS
jgi:hypothetical protein